MGRDFTNKESVSNSFCRASTLGFVIQSVRVGTLMRSSTVRSLLGEVVVVRVDATAELGCLHETLRAHLIRAIEWNVELEEARVRLWEPCLTHVRVQAHLVAP